MEVCDNAGFSLPQVGAGCWLAPVALALCGVALVL
jgi:hypothetical protein